ncbi:MAG: glycosyltransferase [Bacteroidota bacterium]
MKQTIAIASTLKPVIDPRVYEKIGISLGRSGKYNVHIFGAYPTAKSDHLSLFLHPVSLTRSSIFKRLILPFKLYRQIKKVKPNLAIITTHELLLTGLLLKLFTRCKLIYDIQENYYNNLIFQRNYPWGIRHMLAGVIRLREIIYTRFYNHFILAEKCYQEELGFIGSRYTILENKFAAPEQPIEFIRQDKITLLLSGTISEAYGVLEAIRFFRHLPPDEFELTIIGHCPGKKTYDQVTTLIQGLDNVNNMASLQPVPHTEILKQIGNKTIGILPYQPNKSTENKLPSKLYEYIGLGIPVLISPNPLWEMLIKKYNAGLIVDFITPPPIDNIRNSFSLIHDRLSTDLKEVMWNDEENKILSLTDNLI